MFCRKRLQYENSVKWLVKSNKITLYKFLNEENNKKQMDSWETKSPDALVCIIYVCEMYDGPLSVSFRFRFFF